MPPAKSTAAIADALAAIPNRELRALRSVLDDDSVTVPQLLRWLDAATARELSRRAGFEAELECPSVYIRSPGEVESSLVVLAFLHVHLKKHAAVAKFIDTAADALCVTRAASL
jgi:hypothetical protein